MGDVNKLFVFKSLFTTPSNVLPSHLKQTFLLIIWIFTVGEGDEIESRLPFKIFCTLPCLTLVWNSWRFFMVGELVSKRNRWCCWMALAWSFGSKKGLVRSKKFIAKLMSICSKCNSKSPQVWFKVKLCCKIFHECAAVFLFSNRRT